MDGVSFHGDPMDCYPRGRSCVRAGRHPGRWDRICRVWRRGCRCGAPSSATPREMCRSWQSFT